MNHAQTNVQSIRNQFEKHAENSQPKFILQRSVTTIGPFDYSEKCKKTISNERITRKPINSQRSTTSINLLNKDTCCKTNNESHSKTNLLSRQLSDPVKRGNIKRSPAFRCDKSFEEGAGAVLANNTSRLNLSNKIRMFEKCHSNNKEPNEPKFKYRIKNPNNKDNSTISNSPTKYKTNQVLKRELDLILERRKQFPNTKVVFNESTNNYSCDDLLKSAPQCSSEKNTLHGQYAQINKNNKKLSNSPVTKITSIDNLTDTLKKALQSPLPDGPPPKKPPRTFAHKSPSLQKNPPSSVPSEKKPVSARNDPVRMLNKLENALLQNRIKSPMTRRKVLDMENIKSNTINNITKADNIVEAKNNNFFECLPLCNTNEYAEPICSRSSFFVDHKILQSTQIESRTKTPTSSLDRRKAEHVYAEPFAIFKNLPDLTKTQRALELNLNDGEKFSL